MIQKKVCMVGTFGAGKSSLVRQFVYSKFSERYHSTVGVKIDRKVVVVDDIEMTMVLWDLSGRDSEAEVSPIYLRGALRGAHGVIYVADGTSRTSCDAVSDLQSLANSIIGEVPSVIALNKTDLVDRWALTAGDQDVLGANGPVHATSAKSGDGVEAMYTRIALDLVAGRPHR